MAFTFPWTERRRTPEEIMRGTLPSEEELGRRYMEAGGGMGPGYAGALRPGEVSGYGGNGVGTEAERGFESSEEASRYLSWRVRAGYPETAEDTPEMLREFRTRSGERGMRNAPETGVEAMSGLMGAGQRITGTAVGPEGYAIGSRNAELGTRNVPALMGETGRMRERVGAMSERGARNAELGIMQGRQYTPSTGMRDVNIVPQIAAAGLQAKYGRPFHATPSGIMTNVPPAVSQKDYLAQREATKRSMLGGTHEAQARKAAEERSGVERVAERASREKIALAKSEQELVGLRTQFVEPEEVKAKADVAAAKLEHERELELVKGERATRLEVATIPGVSQERIQEMRGKLKERELDIEEGKKQRYQGPVVKDPSGLLGIYDQNTQVYKWQLPPAKGGGIQIDPTTGLLTVAPAGAGVEMEAIPEYKEEGRAVTPPIPGAVENPRVPGQWIKQNAEGQWVVVG